MYIHWKIKMYNQDPHAIVFMEVFFDQLKNEMFYENEKDFASFDEFAIAIYKYID